MVQIQLVLDICDGDNQVFCFQVMLSSEDEGTWYYHKKM